MIPLLILLRVSSYTLFAMRLLYSYYIYLYVYIYIYGLGLYMRYTRTDPILLLYTIVYR